MSSFNRFTDLSTADRNSLTEIVGALRLPISISCLLKQRKMKTCRGYGLLSRSGKAWNADADSMMNCNAGSTPLICLPTWHQRLTQIG
jgi:hypothetical protein